MSIHVLVVCTDPGLARALPALLEQPKGHPTPLVLRSAALDELQRLPDGWEPHVLLLGHPGDDEALDMVLSVVRERSPRTRTLVLLQVSSDGRQLHLLRKGAHGVLLATDGAGQAFKAVHAVHRGELWFTRTMLRQAIQALVQAAPRPILVQDGCDQELTPREAEIVRLIGAGLSNKEIARHLQISDQTVKTHLHHVYVKLQQSGRYKAFLARGTPSLGSGGHPMAGDQLSAPALRAASPSSPARAGTAGQSAVRPR